MRVASWWIAALVVGLAASRAQALGGRRGVTGAGGSHKKEGNATTSALATQASKSEDVVPGYILHSKGEDVNPPANNAMTMLMGAGSCGGMMQSKCGCGWAGPCKPHKCADECKRWEECVGIVVHTDQERCWLIDARWPANNFHTIPGPTRQIFIKGDYVTNTEAQAVEKAEHFGQGNPGHFDAPDGRRWYWTVSWIAGYFHPVDGAK